jgi:hypothetical protein
LPEYLIFVTNVLLSAVPGTGGKDQIVAKSGSSKILAITPRIDWFSGAFAVPAPVIPVRVSDAAAPEDP